MKFRMALNVHRHRESVWSLGSNAADLKTWDGDGMVRHDLMIIPSVFSADHAWLGANPIQVLLILVSFHPRIIPLLDAVIVGCGSVRYLSWEYCI